MRTIAIIQARMGSTRLPGKVLRKLCGRSVLDHLITRVRRAKRLDGLIVATTEASGDDAIVDECVRLEVPCLRGSEQDVLSRYVEAANRTRAQAIVRVTADCPVFDGGLLDEMLLVFLEANHGTVSVDYLSNVQRRTFPRGLDVEIFTATALAQAEREATQRHEREHVTPYLYEHPDRFRLHSFEGKQDLSSHRWTLDTPEDWNFVAALYGALGPDFSTQDVLTLLQARPELVDLNDQVQQKALRH